MRHRPSRPIDLSRGAASSSAHDLQIWACFARSPRMVQLVSALLRQAARSSPVVNGRTERRPIEAASRQRRWALGLSGRIAAGGPGLPLSAALGVECSVRVSAPTISASSMKVAGNKYGSAVYLLIALQDHITRCKFARLSAQLYPRVDAALAQLAIPLS